MSDKFTIPNGIEKDDKLYNIVYLNEMTGKQQDYLINTKYKSPIEHIEPILKDLIVKIENEDGEVLEEKKEKIVKDLLPLDDIAFLLVKLREITFDDKMIIKCECSHCEAENELQFNLSSLEVIPSQKPKKDPVELPKSGLMAEYQPLKFEALKRYSSSRERMLNSATTSTVSMLLAKLGDCENPTEKQVKNLPAKDIRYIQENAPEYNRLDTKLEATCKKCEEDFEHELEVLASDFLAQ